MILILGGEKVVTGHQLFKVGIHSLVGIFLLYLRQALLHCLHLVHQIMNQTIHNEYSISVANNSFTIHGTPARLCKHAIELYNPHMTLPRTATLSQKSKL